MFKFIIIIITINLVGCTRVIDRSSDFSKPFQDTLIPVNGEMNAAEYIKTGEIPVIIIDNCEYFYSRNAYGSSVSHKGNCNNIIHTNKVTTIQPIK